MLQRQKSKLQLQTALVRYWWAKSGRALASIALRTSPSDAGYSPRWKRGYDTSTLDYLGMGLFVPLDLFL